MQFYSNISNRGGYRGSRGGYRGTHGGRGRGRGDGDGDSGYNQDTTGEGSTSWQNGQGRGRGRGRGYGRGHINEEQQAQIVNPKRPNGNRVSSEGTDDIIIAAEADKQLQHIAGFVLRKKDFTGFNSQRFVRSFVNSCLLNLSNHHSVDTSGLLRELGSNVGCSRLSEILLMPMSTDAGDSIDTLSFQFVILPLIGVLTRESVCQTTMASESGLIYSTVYVHREHFLEDGVLRCMDELLERGSLQDLSSGAIRLLRQDSSICKITSFQRALLAISRLVYQLVKRFKDAKIELSNVIKRLHTQFLKVLQLGIESDEDRYLNMVLGSEISRLQKIVAEAEGSLTNIEPSLVYPKRLQSSDANGPNMVHLARTYDPPGNKSPNGPRHDNDHDDISLIKVLPTRDEITSVRPPFLPSNGIADAPHFLPPGWKRQLDIHFRLYREDMLDPLRRGISAFLNVLEKTEKGDEGALLQKRELKRLVGSDVSLDVYGDVKFHGMDCSKNAGGAIEISFAQPFRLTGMNQKRRKDFWERSKRRLTQGSLICIVSRADNHTNSSADSFQMMLGAITRRDADALSMDETRAHLHISLTDPDQYIRMLNSATQPGDHQCFLVESMGGFFESYKPILKSLQSKFNLAVALPFGKYLAPTRDEIETMRNAAEIVVDPPEYAHVLGFKYGLSVLLGGRPCILDITDRQSITMAEQMIQRYSNIDETQAKALIHTLSREVALISGPPGTGKTKIGVDLIRVLLHNKIIMDCVPILCICYTNHALDQFLEHLLDSGITDIVRVGARSKSTRLEDFNLESLLATTNKPTAVRDVLRSVAEERADISSVIRRLEEMMQSDVLTWEYLEPYLQTNNHEQWEQFDRDAYHQNSDTNPEATVDEMGFTTVGKKVEAEQIYLRWVNGKDIDDKIKKNQNITKRKSKKRRGGNMFTLLADGEVWEQPELQLHHIPNTKRPLSMLDGDIWEMSMYERRSLIESWRREIQLSIMETMSGLLRKSEDLMQKKNGAFNEIRRGILQKASVIGMTTNGAAKSQSLLEAVSPKVIMCEEAGEVLEAHILAALSNSTKHLILIGDHLQLRPQIETYTLSSDSHIGRNYNLDKSLFERLVTADVNPLPMSHLTIQRRMRPEISNLIRKSLYPDLVDGPNVREYPPLSGMGANLFFMDHKHPEDSKDQYGMQSYANTFEVNMVEALVQYLIKNGYDKPGDIAVLTPYLGQLSKLRDCLRESFVVVIDDRDQEQLDATEVEALDERPAAKVNENIALKRLDLQRHLTIRTIDNYQGEEAKIVIISLVRSDISEDELSFKSKSSIGFLKSPNRTNVLLSRAQHGHPDDMEHQLVMCNQPCPRLQKDCDHVCPKRCGDACGNCMVPVAPFVLPCSHIYKKPRCWESKNRDKIICQVKITQKLKTCEHEYTAECHKNIATITCRQKCNVILQCGHNCTRLCSTCQKASIDPHQADAPMKEIPRTVHVCGEHCPPVEFCVECKDPETMNLVVDLIMQQSLSDVDVDEDPIIVLACGHALTMTSLDGMMEMSSYYEEYTDPKTGDVTYTGKRDLPGEEVSQVPCHLCRKPIIGILRYGRRIKYAQLSLRLKKHQVAQAKSLKDAIQAFQVAQVMMEEQQSAFLDELSQVYVENGVEPPRMERRKLGKFHDQSTWFLDSNFSANLSIYNIPNEQAKLWRTFVLPASKSFSKFRNIYENALKSPSKQVFDATVSHLYRLKTFKAGPSFAPSAEIEEYQMLMSEEDYAATADMIQTCILESGLPRDGHGGSSHVDSLHEMTNVLILMLGHAFEALDEVGVNSGWYWFVEDLIQCAGIHVEMLKETAQIGRFDRKLAYARMSRMELLLKAMQWVGMGATGNINLEARLKYVDYLTEQFMMELKEIKEGCPLGIKGECLARATVLEERIADAIIVARNPTRYQKVTTKEKIELFRAMSQELGGSGHWYRCQNGHTYVIGNCGGAVQRSICPECGAPVGGTGHTLQVGNSVDEEFEGFYRSEL
ncbi:hypothetical protein BGX27_009209 [Mortierella sp. AM989]|nr:hypothetical protein BGX27_009209 [Mortierella sp. AM989]